MSYKILIVDDEPANLRLLERLFRHDYQVITASSGIEALELLGQHDVAVIISDQRMPGMTGIEFLKRAAQMRQHTVRIILTGYTDVNALVEAINSGVVYKYVPKPWVNEDLRQTVSRALDHYEMNKRHHELTFHNERLDARLKTARQAFVRLTAETLDLKDVYAHNHARRVESYAVAIGHRLNLEAEEIEHLSLAAYLHDVGRIGIPDEILNKISKLTDEENKIVKLNSERAVQILASVPELSEIALAVRHRNEHFDGSGFPDNLPGERIPLLSRIVAVACAYDEMTSPRASGQSLPHDEALEKLRENGEKQFDSSVVQIFGEIESIGLIRAAIEDGLAGGRLLPSRVFFDVKNLSTAELLQQFKTEPMLAIDVLKLANVSNGDEKTAQMLPAMTALGEEKLRAILEQNGLPARDAQFEDWSARALRRAIAAQLLAAHTNVAEPDDAYTLGLLYEAGEILLGSLYPEEMLELENLEDEARARGQIEKFGTDAVQISQWMLESCGLPRSLTSAVKAYRESMHINNPLTLLLHAAHKIAEGQEPYKTADDALAADCAAILGLNRAEFRQIYERAGAITDNRIEALQEI
ncbi:MAG: response regulator [Acidobacteriota bacterium]|nr:response regulator [Acidobacteriota bacterium]